MGPLRGITGGAPAEKDSAGGTTDPYVARPSPRARGGGPSPPKAPLPRAAPAGGDAHRGGKNSLGGVTAVAASGTPRRTGTPTPAAAAGGTAGAGTGLRAPSALALAAFSAGFSTALTAHESARAPFEAPMAPAETDGVAGFGAAEVAAPRDEPAALTPSTPAAATARGPTAPLPWPPPATIICATPADAAAGTAVDRCRWSRGDAGASKARDAPPTGLPPPPPPSAAGANEPPRGSAPARLSSAPARLSAAAVAAVRVVRPTGLAGLARGMIPSAADPRAVAGPPRSRPASPIAPANPSRPSTDGAPAVSRSSFCLCFSVVRTLSPPPASLCFAAGDRTVSAGRSAAAVRAVLSLPFAGAARAPALVFLVVTAAAEEEAAAAAPPPLPPTPRSFLARPPGSRRQHNASTTHTNRPRHAPGPGLPLVGNPARS